MAQYVFRDTGERYNGSIVNYGSGVYSSTGGGYEGEASRELILQETSSDTIAGGTRINNTMSSDVPTQFIIGENRGNTFYHPTYSNQNYYYSNGMKVPKGTRLHHHTIPKSGRSNFMTQHTMDGKEQDVTPTRPKRNRINRKRTVPRRNMMSATVRNRQNRTRLNNNGMTARTGRMSTSSMVNNGNRSATRTTQRMSNNVRTQQTSTSTRQTARRTQTRTGRMNTGRSPSVGSGGGGGY